MLKIGCKNGTLSKAFCPLYMYKVNDDGDQLISYLLKSCNPLTAKLFNLNFHPLEVVSRWRDPQLQVSENNLLFRFDKMEVNCFQILLIDVIFYL